MRYSRILFLAVLAMALVFAGCSQNDEQSNPTASLHQDNQVPSGGKDREVTPIVTSIGAYMTIAWPFLNDSPDNWTGDEGTRTDGAWGYYCGSNRYSHSGADYYARDLNRTGGDYGRNIYAGFAGEVVVAGWDGGYGYSVVIYYESRHVAIRYAHLSSVGVSVGNNVSIRQYIGQVGDSGGADGSHLHLVGYENINDNYGNPIIPTLCDSDYYSCILYFMC